MHEREGVWKYGKGKVRLMPMRWQLDDLEWVQVQRLLNGNPRGRDFLPERLRLTQDKFGKSPAAPFRASAYETPANIADVQDFAISRYWMAVD